MRTLYMTDHGNYVYSSKEECEKAQAEEKRKAEEFAAFWADNAPEAKLNKFKGALDESMNILPGTIASCTYQSLQIKGMVQVCQAFVEENKQYLNYY